MAVILRHGVDGATCPLRTCGLGSVLPEHSAVRISLNPSGKKALQKLAGTEGRLLNCWATPTERAVFHAPCWEVVAAALNPPVPSAKRARRGSSTRAAVAVAADILVPEERRLLEASLEVCDPERFDSTADATKLAATLAGLIRGSKHTVVFTGAGVSVSAGIPDYRGTAGVDVVGYDAAASAAAAGAAGSSGSAAAMPEGSAGAGGGSEVSASASALSARGGKDGAMSKGKGKFPISSEASSSTSASSAAGAAAGANLHGLSSAAELAEALSCSASYTDLRPTRTHAALAQLHARGQLQHVITQNCDGLHRRSGLPRSSLCVLHGDVFVEFCEACGREYERPYCVDVYSTDCKREPWFERCAACSWGHYTGRRCDSTVPSGGGAAACGGKLRDTIVNFGDDLHEAVLGGLPRAEAECRAADLIICLGSSLTVTPACDLPTLRRKGARIAIVNLQETPLDGHASVAVRAFYPCDGFFELVMRELAPGGGDSGAGAGCGHGRAGSSSGT